MDHSQNDRQDFPATASYVRWVAGPDAQGVPPAEPPPGWSTAQPARLPRSTSSPAVLAFAVILIVWGPVSTLIMSGVGLLIAVFAIRGWIEEMLHESETRQ